MQVVFKRYKATFQGGTGCIFQKSLFSNHPSEHGTKQSTNRLAVTTHYDPLPRPDPTRPGPQSLTLWCAHCPVPPAAGYRAKTLAARHTDESLRRAGPLCLVKRARYGRSCCGGGSLFCRRHGRGRFSRCPTGQAAPGCGGAAISSSCVCNSVGGNSSLS